MNAWPGVGGGSGSVGVGNSALQSSSPSFGKDREINKRVAFGTALEARTQTIYDAAGRVTEVRNPRYFDTTDTNGYNKARSPVQGVDR